MPQMQVCSQGHRWDPLTDRRQDVQVRWSICPYCGGSVEMFSVHDTASGSASSPGGLATAVVATPPTAQPKIAGYEIDSVLGYGGMGVVYKARQVSAHRDVALKMLSAGLRARPSELARFQKETQAAKRISHPHVVDVYDVDEVEGLPFVVMELMDRGSLADCIAGNPLPPRRAAEVIEMLARGVQAAHDKGIVHRDLKPANVLLCSPPDNLDNNHPAAATLRLLGVPKVCDFGLAKQMDDEGVQTRTGAVMGTPAYMAPEQAQGKSKTVGPPADVWALGAILYHCLTGEPPFKAPTMLETLDLVRTQDPPRPARLRGGIPRDLETICLKCLEKDVSLRYQTAEQLANDLRRHLDGQSILARRTPWRRAARGLGNHAMAVVVVCLALTTITLAFSLWQRRGFRADRGGTSETPSVAHFTNFVKRHGFPEGVGPLTEEQVRRVALSYRFHYRGKQVEKVEAIDRHGQLNPRNPISPYLAGSDSGRIISTTFQSFLQSRITRLSPTRQFGRPPGALDTACAWEYQRDEQGHLVKEIARDMAGRVVWVFLLTSSDTGHYIDERGMLLTRSGSGASLVKLVSTDAGLVKEVRFLGRNGKPRPDSSGTFGRRYEHDQLGLVTAITYLGPRDQRVEHQLGYARTMRRWDQRGHLLEETYFDLRDQPTRGPVGSGAQLRWQYDEDGNPTLQENIGLDGKPTAGSVRMTYDRRGNLRIWQILNPVVREDRPVTRREMEYDSNDNCTLIRTFGGDGKPVLDPITASYALAMTHDGDGRVLSMTFLGRDGKPWPAPEPAEGMTAVRGEEVRISYRYNSRGQVIAEEYFNLKDERTEDSNGVARYTCTYDDAGRQAELSLFNAEGELVNGARGFARRTWKYDDQGRLEEMANFDAEGRLTNLASMPEGVGGGGLTSFYMGSRFGGTVTFAVGRLDLDYDDRGNLQKVALYGENGRPMADALGVARLQAKYDELGHLEEVATFDVEGSPKANRAGVARTKWTYDGFGNLTEVATYGADGKLVLSPYGVARQVRQFDERYNLISDAFYGADGEPTLGALGYARAIFAYDKDDNITKSAYFGVEGESVKTRAVWLNTANRPVAGTDGMGDLPERGDVIESYDGEEVHCAKLFAQKKQREGQGGDKKAVRILREGRAMTLRLPAGVLRREDFFRPGGRGRGMPVGVPGMLEPVPFVQTRGVTHLAVEP